MKIVIPKPEMVLISKLIRNPKNVKTHSKAQIHDLVELIKMVGFKDPLVIDRKFVVWAGHGRLDAAIILEMTEVPCIFLDKLSAKQKKVFLLMDNKVNESNWISENVKFVFDDVGADAFSKFETGFDDYFQKLMNIPEEEWQSMPEFANVDQDSFRRIMIKFDNEKDVQIFAKLLKQMVTARTKWLWFPQKEKNDLTGTRYTDES